MPRSRVTAVPGRGIPASSQLGRVEPGILEVEEHGLPDGEPSISFIICCISGGGSFCSPSRAAASEVK